jgi:hypothetical protein
VDTYAHLGDDDTDTRNPYDEALNERVRAEREHAHTYERETGGYGYACPCGDRTTAMGAVEYAAFHGDPCESFAGLMVNRTMNTGGGRPSDAARYAASLHERLGCEGFRARYEEGANSKSLAVAAGSLGIAPGELSG